jgi:hypothetical protein
MFDLGEILGLQGRDEERRAVLEQALALYQAKGNEVAAERARTALAAGLTAS